MSKQPLSGLKVLDFTTLLPGPLAALILAEAGAEVTKIERPGGEIMRHREPYWGKQSAYFALLNRGKKSLALDLKDPHAIAALEKLFLAVALPESKRHRTHVRAPQGFSPYRNSI